MKIVYWKIRFISWTLSSFFQLRRILWIYLCLCDGEMRRDFFIFGFRVMKWAWGSSLQLCWVHYNVGSSFPPKLSDVATWVRQWGHPTQGLLLPALLRLLPALFLKCFLTSRIGHSVSQKREYISKYNLIFRIGHSEKANKRVQEATVMCMKL